MIQRDELERNLNLILTPERFDDYAPNGLQIAGREEIRKLVTGVSANQALIDEAIAGGADAILVHHGFFWRNEPRTLVGPRAQRVGALFRAGISLFGYHLPLDVHPAFGNNHGLLRALEGKHTGEFPAGSGISGVVGELKEPVALSEFLGRVERACMRTPQLLGPDDDRLISRIGVCTGGAASAFPAAVEAGVDLFLTGEPSEPSTALAWEFDRPFVAAGHHATERFGPLLLGEFIERRFGIEVEFIDIENPV